MKKTASVLAVALFLGLVLSSCRAKKVDCPAYGQNRQVVAEKHS